MKKYFIKKTEALGSNKEIDKFTAFDSDKR